MDKQRPIGRRRGPEKPSKRVAKPATVVALSAEQKIDMLEARVEELSTILRGFASAMFHSTIATPCRTEFEEDLFGELEDMHYTLADMPKLDLNRGT